MLLDTECSRRRDVFGEPALVPGTRWKAERRRARWRAARDMDRRLQALRLQGAEPACCEKQLPAVTSIKSHGPQRIQNLSVHTLLNLHSARRCRRAARPWALAGAASPPAPAAATSAAACGGGVSDSFLLLLGLVLGDFVNSG